jgi:hypothetical protein
MALTNFHTYENAEDCYSLSPAIEGHVADILVFSLAFFFAFLYV